MKNLDLLIPQAQREADRWRWATVTAIGPLRIRLDGETDPLDITPDNTIGPVKVGDRVWTQTTGRRILVTGKANGLVKGSLEQVGVVKMYVGDTPPDNHLMCWGGGFDSRTYPELAAIVGDKFGPHSGTTYYLPNMNGRTPVGYHAYDVEFNALGKAGGEKAHTLTTAEMPAHAHDQNGHTWLWGSAGGNVFSNADAVGGPAPGNRLYTWQGQAGWKSTLNQGGGLPHNVIQPYMTMNFIICAR